MGESKDRPLRLNFDRRLFLDGWRPGVSLGGVRNAVDSSVGRDSNADYPTRHLSWLKPSKHGGGRDEEDSPGFRVPAARGGVLAHAPLHQPALRPVRVLHATEFLWGAVVSKWIEFHGL